MFDIKKALLSAIPLIDIADTESGRARYERRQSWLTIENPNAITTISIASKCVSFVSNSIIGFFNSNSKDFRIVSHILSKEKLLLKREFGNTQAPALTALLSDEINKDNPSPHSSPSLYQVIEKPNSNKLIIEASSEVDAEMNAQSRLDRLLSSLFYFLLSQSELICYFFMILNHLKSASVLSIPLPISVFLWAMLCIPRPTKTYWISTITYVEAVVVIKYLFQFKIYKWNQETTALDKNMVNIISILGIDRKENQFALYDLFVLLVIFLHRMVLKVNLVLLIYK